MLDFIIGPILIIAGFLLLKISVNILIFYFKRNKVQKKTSSLKSGVFVKHGMKLNPRTGRLCIENTPSKAAYDYL